MEKAQRIMVKSRYRCAWLSDPNGCYAALGDDGIELYNMNGEWLGDIDIPWPLETAEDVQRALLLALPEARRRASGED